MILVRRLAAPTELLARQNKWTERWKSRPGGDFDWATTSAKKLLRETLSRKSHNKCVYCESLLGGAARPEIEHYEAKTVRQDLVFEWSNLFLACGFCNTTKLDQAHGGRLLKPDTDDGEEHFWLNRDTGGLEAAPGTDGERAKATIHFCDLNRETLCEGRLLLFLRVQRYWHEIVRGALPHGLLPEFAEFLRPRTEHKFAIRSGLPPSLAVEDRRMYHAAD